MIQLLDDDAGRSLVPKGSKLMSCYGCDLVSSSAITCIVMPLCAKDCSPGLTLA